MKLILLVVALGALIGMLLLALKLVEKQQGEGKAGGSDDGPPEGSSSFAKARSQSRCFRTPPCALAFPYGHRC